jgi:predicted dehydrogenase
LVSNVLNLHQAVRDTLASGRLGTPVFVRYRARAADQRSLVPQLARMIAEVREWLGQGLDRIVAVGAVANGSVSLTLELRKGATAVVSAATGTEQGAGVDLVILGNRGALYHDAGHDAVAAERIDRPPDARMLTLIQKALVRALECGD